MRNTILTALCTAALAVGLTACETSTATQTTDSQVETGKGKGKNATDSSSKGKGPLTWGNWQVVGKIQVKNNYGDYNVVARVKNTGDVPDEGLYTMTILKGTEILGTADCSTSTVAPGSVGTADCFSADKFQPGWTEITVEDMF